MARVSVAAAVRVGSCLFLASSLAVASPLLGRRHDSLLLERDGADSWAFIREQVKGVTDLQIAAILGTDKYWLSAGGSKTLRILDGSGARVKVVPSAAQLAANPAAAGTFCPA